MIDDVSLAGSWAEALTYPHSIAVSEYRAHHTQTEGAAPDRDSTSPPPVPFWRSVLSRFFSLFHGTLYPTDGVRDLVS